MFKGDPVGCGPTQTHRGLPDVRPDRLLPEPDGPFAIDGVRPLAVDGGLPPVPPGRLHDRVEGPRLAAGKDDHQLITVRVAVGAHEWCVPLLVDHDIMDGPADIPANERVLKAGQAAPAVDPLADHPDAHTAGPGDMQNRGQHGLWIKLAAVAVTQIVAGRAGDCQVNAGRFP